MAVDSSWEGEPLIEEFLKENGSEPANCRCSKSLEASPTDANQHFSSEIPPTLVEDTSLPSGLYQPLSGSPGQNVYSISVLSKDVDDAQFLSVLDVPNQSEGPICVDAHLNCQNCFGLRMEKEEGYSPCIIDLPSGNENSILPQSYEEGVESFKTENLLARLLWRQASFKFSGRDKSVTEKVHDMPNNKCRRLKRSASFDSRKVVFLFSILWAQVFMLSLLGIGMRVKFGIAGFDIYDIENQAEG